MKKENTPINHDALLYTVLNYLKTTRRRHYECEDTWYNCNAHPTEQGGDQSYGEGECSCGADKWNEKLDEQIKLIEDALNGA